VPDPLLAGPSTQASPEHIYLLRVVVSTTAPTARLFLERPSTLIRAESRQVRGAVAARFVGFGRGPLVLVARAGARRASATFVAAVTPGPSPDLRFRSVQQGPGHTSVRVANRNGVPAIPLTSAAQRDRVRRFSVPAGQAAARGPAPGTEPLPPTVLAFYYPWYEVGDWTGGKPIAGYNINLTPYASGDPATIDRHIAQARQAGIDGFIVSWWGRDLPWDDNVEALEERIPPGFTFALYLEVFSPHFQSEDDLVGEIDYALDAYATSEHYLRIDGRPVLYAFSTHNVMRELGAGQHPRYGEVWRRVLTGLAREGHDPVLIGEGRPFDVEDFDVFDGMHVYGTEDPSLTPRRNHEMALTARAWAAVHGGERRIWGASVLPGYDDRHIPGRKPDFFPREDGALYKAQWEAAIHTASDQVLVVSFNEWMETTNIEPNEEWGERYLDLTGELSHRYSASR